MGRESWNSSLEEDEVGVVPVLPPPRSWKAVCPPTAARVPEGEAEAMAAREVRVLRLPGSEEGEEKVLKLERAVEAVRRPARMRVVVSRGVKRD